MHTQPTKLEKKLWGRLQYRRSGARLVRGKAAEYKHKLNSSMCKKAKLGAKLGSGSVGINGTL